MMINYVQHIQQYLSQGLSQVAEELACELDPDRIQVEPTKDARHGDFASNVAMIFAKHTKMAPRDLASKIIAALKADDAFTAITIAGPGFINFTIAPAHLLQVVPAVLQAKEQYGCSDLGAGQAVHVEYVSANPTGPLHVGHGRGAAFGACVANLLKAVGYRVHQEYYVNDAGRQMRILGLSVWLRSLEIQEVACTLPANAYQGDYIIAIAQQLLEQYPGLPKVSDVAFMQEVTQKYTDDQADLCVDALINEAIKALGDDNFELIRRFSLEQILADIKEDLTEFGVCQDEWFYESRLMEEGLFDASLQLLKDHGHVYQQDGATWFRATDFGDDKDRVLVRENGQPTYFASDVAYHLYKYQQGYDHVIDVFGADHHGYIARINAFLQGLGEDPGRLKILLVQFAILYRGKEKVSMSTRGGQFVTLRQLREEVGNDAARYFYVMRKPEQHLDFDLELAKAQSSDNPVYYIQYAYARICSVWRQCEEQNIERQQQCDTAGLEHLNSDHERRLVKALEQYPRVLELAALQYEPHSFAHYLYDLAHQFHSYYNATKFLVSEASVREARLSLIAAIQLVIGNGLVLLGLSAPEKM